MGAESPEYSTLSFAIMPDANAESAFAGITRATTPCARSWSRSNA
jgi:hypothetical protein